MGPAVTSQVYKYQKYHPVHFSRSYRNHYFLFSNRIGRTKFSKLNKITYGNDRQRLLCGRRPRFQAITQVKQLRADRVSTWVGDPRFVGRGLHIETRSERSERSERHFSETVGTPDSVK